MSRWAWFAICIILSPLLLVCGLRVPVHLRAVETSVLERAGRKTMTLVERGLGLARENNLGAARMIWQAAVVERLPGREQLGLAVTNLAANAARATALDPRPGQEPFTEFIVRTENRERALELMRHSARPLVQELLRCRALTNTQVFSPSASSAGQALDAALAVGGLLADGGNLSRGLSDELSALMVQANHGGSSLQLEDVLMDLMSLGQRFNWGQLVVFVSRVEDAETLRLLANLARNAGPQLPVLFATVALSGQPAATAAYLVNFSQSGLADAGESLRFEAGGVKELLQRRQPLYISSGRSPLALDVCWRTPWLALTLKWFCYLTSGFLLAAAMHFLRPPVKALEQPLLVRGFHVAQEVLFALGFLVVVLLLSEPFLTQESQKIDFPFRLRLPTVGTAIPAAINHVNPSLMNQLSLLTLLLFFVLQGLLYLASLFKLAEIRRQQVPPRMKLKLLENEDHLFDAGLYLGFCGTIISLILVSLGVIKPSLMAAYSSTSFGIIFVSIFKICHLRPVRRGLLMEAEAESMEALASAATPKLAVP